MPSRRSVCVINRTLMNGRGKASDRESGAKDCKGPQDGTKWFLLGCSGHYACKTLGHLGVMFVTLLDCIWQCQMLCDAPSCKPSISYVRPEMFSLKGGIGHVRGSPIEQFVAEYDHPSIWAKTLGSRPIEYSTLKVNRLVPPTLYIPHRTGDGLRGGCECQ